MYSVKNIDFDSEKFWEWINDLIKELDKEKEKG